MSKVIESTDDEWLENMRVPIYLESDVSVGQFHRGLLLAGLDYRIDAVKGIVIVSRAHGEQRLN